jgi:hypothetical protein
MWFQNISVSHFSWPTQIQHQQNYFFTKHICPLPTEYLCYSAFSNLLCILQKFLIILAKPNYDISHNALMKYKFFIVFHWKDMDPKTCKKENTVSKFYTLKVMSIYYGNLLDNALHYSRTLYGCPWDWQMLHLIERCPDYRGQIEWKWPTWDWTLVSN